MQPIIAIAYFILSLAQMAAIYAGLESWIGLHWIIAGPLAFFICGIPLIGTVIGMAGAVTAWHFSWLKATGLFFGPFIGIVIFGLASAAFAKSR